ncbi:hypothetical protein GY45DRAFT_1326588 [Cubamyces sp. BRFM 1775]|nr:hypothetical protein GY45DRAFT_1326588 [Cubamyces sp. BRFM 1775]
MGHSYSVAQEEQEEEEFYRLIEAVEIAQQRPGQQDDLESGLRKPRVARERAHSLSQYARRHGDSEPNHSIPVLPALEAPEARQDYWMEVISRPPSPVSDVAGFPCVHHDPPAREEPPSYPPSESARTHRSSTRSPERGRQHRRPTTAR